MTRTGHGLEPRRLDPARRTTERAALLQDLATLDREIGNLSQAIADWKPSGVLLDEIARRDARRQKITAELERLSPLRLALPVAA
jgi:hypothetical protein